MSSLTRLNPDDGGYSLLPFPSFGDPRHPGVSYAVDHIPVSVDAFRVNLDAAFQSSLRLAEVTTEQTSRRVIGYRTITEHYTGHFLGGHEASDPDNGIYRGGNEDHFEFTITSSYELYGNSSLSAVFSTGNPVMPQGKSSDLLNFKVAEKGRIEINYWKQYGKALYACIDTIFKSDAAAAKTELAKGLAYIDTSYSAKAVGKIGVTGADQHTPPSAAAVNMPWRGPNGTIFIAKEYLATMYSSITHEEGNILAARVTLSVHGQVDFY